MAGATTRPRPRPAPRPRPKALQTNTSSPPNANSSNTSSSSIQVQDDDEMFMKNRSRSAKTWKQLDEKDEATNARQSRRDDSDEDHSDSSPRSRKLKKTRNNLLPKWQRDADFSRVLSEGLSDPDSDPDGVELVGEATATGANGAAKRKRPRSRSRSITPPPALPGYQLQYARNLVRQTLHAAPRPPSPTYFDPDESTDTIILAPELQNIVESVEAQSQSQSFSQPANETLDDASKSDSDTVIIKVRWQPHPKNEFGKPQSWQFKMYRTENFHTLFDEVADLAGVLSDNITITHNSKRVFSSVTPAALHMFVEAELDACDKVTYEYLRLNAAATRVRSPTPEIEIISDGEDIPAPSRQDSIAPGQDDASDDESTAGDTFKLVLRSSLTQDKDITLTVKSTTSCGAIVKAFLKKAGLSDQYPGAGDTGGSAKPANSKRRGAKTTGQKDPRLFIDGDKMDNATEIGEADLEDGDLIEVTGL